MPPPGEDETAPQDPQAPQAPLDGMGQAPNGGAHPGEQENWMHDQAPQGEVEEPDEADEDPGGDYGDDWGEDGGDGE